MRPNWDETWMDICETIAQRSLCSRAKVGCVVVDQGQSVLAASYNGPPSGYQVKGECVNWCPRAMGVGEISSDYSNCPANHAEINAIARLTSDRNSGSLTAYINRLCCISCAKALAASNISRIICVQTDKDAHLESDSVLEYLELCGVTVEMMITE